MADVTANERTHVPKRPPGRRRRRGAAAALLVGALWLLGYGAGWFGSAPDPQQGGQGDGANRGPQPAGSSGAQLPQEGADAVPDGNDEPNAVLTGAPDEGLSGPVEGAAGPEVGQAAPTREPIPAPSSGMDPDRFESLRSLVRTHLDQGELGRAGQVLGRVRAQVEGHRPQLGALDGLADELEAKRLAAESVILAHLRDGEVLAADLAAERLANEGTWAPAKALGDVLELGDNWLEAPRVRDLPTAELLPRKRRVRLQWQEGWQEGVVASARADRTTVHLRSATGQSYPTVATVAIEPVGSTQREAVEMALTAAHAAAPRLARLWLVRAVLLSEQLDDRGALLRDALRQR